MADLRLPALVRAAGYPSTRQLTAWQFIGSLLLAKCDRTARIHHVGSLTSARWPTMPGWRSPSA
jgi:hypothetical protein